MRKIFHLIKRYPVSTIMIVAIWVVCLIPIGEIPVTNLNLGDKWAHILMYLILSAVIIAEYAYRHRTIGWRQITIAALILPIIMGGLIELAQAYLTFGNRSGEMLDWIADSIGSAAASLIGIPLANCLSKARKAA